MCTVRTLRITQHPLFTFGIRGWGPTRVHQPIILRLSDVLFVLGSTPRPYSTVLVVRFGNGSSDTYVVPCRTFSGAGRQAHSVPSGRHLGRVYAHAVEGARQRRQAARLVLGVHAGRSTDRTRLSRRLS
eukprot:1195273-Prorocentrum_minimum.AAC.2